MLRSNHGMEEAALMKTVILVVFLVILLPVINSCNPTKPHVAGTPYHHVDGGFRNPPGSPEYAGTWKDTLSPYLDRTLEGIPGYAPTLSPEYILAPEKVREGVTQTIGQDALTWLGHATFLTHLGGKNILTDSFLTEYAIGKPHIDRGRHLPHFQERSDMPMNASIIIVGHFTYVLQTNMARL